MLRHYLLRFQEACTDAHPAVAGTMTGTRVRSEQADADALDAPAILPRLSSCLKGDAHSTTTSIVASLRLSSHDSNSMVAPGPVAQTKTATAVKAEADDNDPRRADLDAIPRCF